MKLASRVFALVICSLASPYALAACEAEQIQVYGPEYANGLNKDLQRYQENFQASKNTKAIDQEIDLTRDELGRIPAGLYKTWRTCQLGALQKARDEMLKQAAASSSPNAKKTASAGAAANASTKPKPASQTLVYGPNQSECLKQGRTADGYITYTNTCKASVAVGYCNVYAAKGQRDGTVCASHNSEFSRTKRTYVTQDLGLAPGATHRLAYRYDTQATFIVACVGGQPLIESFDTNQISVGSKARTACWRFASSKQ
ncbi:hypothetical protein [Achromobacter ruhlandii]|uniref:hypothetical protein n=1 Tax=Achromobacter ruhlandii TaxID=72557 RepID=UPI001EEEE2C8|nr:hypothetical protein [Achromobacter ruhlandii]MCZ8396820.1 hypothetical protein [Achromobacter ruhlandii]